MFLVKNVRLVTSADGLRVEENCSDLHSVKMNFLKYVIFPRLN